MSFRCCCFASGSGQLYNFLEGDRSLGNTQIPCSVLSRFVFSFHCRKIPRFSYLTKKGTGGEENARVRWVRRSLVGPNL